MGVTFAPSFISMLRGGDMMTNKKFMEYYYIQYKSRKDIKLLKGEEIKFRELFAELTIGPDYEMDLDKMQNNSEIIFKRKLERLENHKPYIIHYKLEKNELDYILDDVTVNDDFKTEFLVELINQSWNINEISFSNKFNLSIFDHQNGITNTRIKKLTFGHYYNQQTTIPNTE